MAYEAKIVADSISSAGNRLTTMEVTYPRFVHAELMTHRMFSRNSASSRAIPVQKMIDAVLNDPVLPVWWGKNQSGMQAKEELSHIEANEARETWLSARWKAVESVRRLTEIGLHKQIVNRILEPWLWHTVIVTATEWSNFFALRCHPDAQPEIRVIAEMMRDLYYSDTPRTRGVGFGGWHLPYVDWDEEITADVETLKKISVARCARVSYLRHNNVGDIEKDIELHDRLAVSGHWSPFEHVAKPIHIDDWESGKFNFMQDEKYNIWSGNFNGWLQYRKTFANENR